MALMILIKCTYLFHTEQVFGFQDFFFVCTLLTNIKRPCTICLFWIETELCKIFIVIKTGR